MPPRLIKRDILWYRNSFRGAKIYYNYMEN